MYEVFGDRTDTYSFVLVIIENGGVGVECMKGMD